MHTRTPINTSTWSRAPVVGFRTFQTFKDFSWHDEPIPCIVLCSLFCCYLDWVVSEQIECIDDNKHLYTIMFDRVICPSIIGRASATVPALHEEILPWIYDLVKWCRCHSYLPGHNNSPNQLFSNSFSSRVKRHFGVSSYPIPTIPDLQAHIRPWCKTLSFQKFRFFFFKP